nr:MAG TPA: hypothetical protein [Caudoviricetes sp.]DAW76101.1 MAG TPA: hypothetical protein [Bacteriophage sp.]
MFSYVFSSYPLYHVRLFPTTSSSLHRVNFYQGVRNLVCIHFIP